MINTQDPEEDLGEDDLECSGTFSIAAVASFILCGCSTTRLRLPIKGFLGSV